MCFSVTAKAFCCTLFTIFDYAVDRHQMGTVKCIISNIFLGEAVDSFLGLFLKHVCQNLGQKVIEKMLTGMKPFDRTIDHPQPIIRPHAVNISR